MTENEISYKIRGAIYNVYNALGPGLLESIYERVLIYELQKQGLKAESQVCIHIIYDGKDFGNGMRADIVVEDKVIIELKSVAELLDIHHKQLLTYLRLTDKKLGLLVNFNTININDGIVRIANGLL